MNEDAGQGSMARVIGDAAYALRREKEMTLRDLSEKCGVSVSYLSEIERGLSSVSLDVLLRVAKGLEVAVVDLLGKAPRGKWISCPYCEGTGMKWRLRGEKPEIVQTLGETP